MQMYGTIVDGAGNVRAHTEGEVLVEGDLTRIMETAMFEFRNTNPDKLLLEAIEEGGFEIRLGRV